MDDLLIQEEITIKTEPSVLDGFKEDGHLLLTPSYKKEDLLFLKSGYGNVPNDNRTKLATDKDNDFLFIDPDGAVDHYEEVLEGQTASLNHTKDLISDNFSTGTEDLVVNGKSSGAFTRSPKKSNSYFENDPNKLRTDFTLECSFCMYVTPVEKEMKNHMLKHIDSLELDAFVEISQSDDAYKCLFCPFSSVSSEMFKYHLKFKHVPAKDSTKSHPLKPDQIFESDDEEDAKDESPNFKRKNILLNCKNCSYQCHEIEEMNEHLIKFHPDMLLKCTDCDFSTFNKNVYKVHLETHAEVKAYSCSRCNFSTSRRDAYLQHKSSHAEAKQLTCSVCGFEAKTKQNFLKHRDKHFKKPAKLSKKNILRRNEGVFTCDECSFQARTKQGYNKHKAKHFRKLKTYPEHCFIKTEEDKYACDECSFEARTLQGYNKHKEKHYRKTGSFPKQFFDSGSTVIKKEPTDMEINKEFVKTTDKFICSECNFGTKTLQGFNKHKARHMRMSKQFQYSEPVAAITKSTSTNMFKCDECNFETRAKQALHKHKDKHGRNKNSLLSSRHQSLSQPVHKPKQTHIQQSENKDDFSCSECIFKGKTLLGFLKHKKSHHGKNLQEYPYNCVYCHYRATKKSHLRRHEMIHTGERPYECPHCDYRCNQASTLKVHIRRHTGEMPYSCSVCPFKTFSTCLLKAHLKKHVIPKGTGFTCHICHQIYNTELALKKHEQMHSQPNLLVRRRRRMKQTQNEVKNKKKETLVDPVLSPIIKQELPETASYSPPLTGLYQCSLCDFQCNKFVQLSEHTMNHRNGTFEAEDVTPRKKYFCVECNLHFARKKEIKSHYKITHPGENYQKNR